MSDKGKYSWREMPVSSKGSFREMPTDKVNDPGFESAIPGSGPSNIQNTFRKLKESLLNDYITFEDLNEYGYDNLGDFLKDKKAFNMWYTDRFSSLNPEQRYTILKDIEMKEHRDQAILMLEGVVTEDGIDPIDLQQTQINLMDMISDD